MIYRIVLVVIYILFLGYDTAICEPLTLEQKIDIFMFYLDPGDQQFNNFLLEIVIEILFNLNNLNNETQIELYVHILESRFYKN